MDSITQCGKGTTRGQIPPPQPHSHPLIFQSGQSSEPLINKESGREVNQGQWAWMWPVQQRISVSGLNRSTVAPRGTEGSSHTESLKTGVTLRGCFSTLGDPCGWGLNTEQHTDSRRDTCLCKTWAWRQPAVKGFLCRKTTSKENHTWISYYKQKQELKWFTFINQTCTVWAVSPQRGGSRPASLKIHKNLFPILK